MIDAHQFKYQCLASGPFTDFTKPQITPKEQHIDLEARRNKMYLSNSRYSEER